MQFGPGIKPITSPTPSGCAAFYATVADRCIPCTIIAIRRAFRTYEQTYTKCRKALFKQGNIAVNIICCKIKIEIIHRLQSNIIQIEKKIRYFFKNEVFYNQGHSVSPSIRSGNLGLFVNLGILEFIQRVQIFRDDSFSVQIPCEKRRNSIIKTGT